MNNVAAAVRNYTQFRESAMAPSDWPELDGLRAEFLDRVPEFERFDLTDNRYEQVERIYKDAMIADMRAIANSGDDDETAGRRIYRALIPNEGPLLRWQTDDDFVRKFSTLAPDFYAAIGRLARDDGPIVDAVMSAAATFADLHSQGAATLTMGQIASIAITVAGIARPHEAAPLKVTKARELAKLLTGEPIFAGNSLERGQVEHWFDLLKRIEAVMRDQWQWAPRDLVDVQGFAWAAMDEEWVVAEDDDDALLARFEGSALFRAVRDAWTDEQAAAFCTVARAVHDAGLDWYHVNLPRAPVRFGRKPDRSRPAVAAQGYLAGSGEPRIYFNERALDLNRGDVMFDEEGAAAFAEEMAGHAETIAQWKPPEPPRPGRWPDEAGDDGADEDNGMETGNMAKRKASNLIFYGPPGTGKTYSTASRAVELCGEEAPAERAALMARYRQLTASGRIEFVTFHQSMAYEEFVEGLRPSSVDEGGESLSAGFRLAPTSGIFRLIARRAETSTGPGDTAFSVGGQQVFKMSLGDSGDPDEAYLFDEAIDEGHITLGFEDIDWSDPEFNHRDAIMAVCQEAAGDPTLNAQSAVVQMPHIFRNWMKQGDWVVVSKGTGLFRAIGIVTGGYRFEPREGGGYAHQRDVQWLWSDREGVPVEEIYPRRFSMRTTYVMTRADLNIPALERYANSQQEANGGEPEHFVLVIDEINRANISKVFGELITLLEPDKRIGEENELRVTLPYSKTEFGVPANLHIIGTMNTADRSIALLDTALRRRFEFEELMPRPDLLGTAEGIDLNVLLTKLNDRIEYLFDREHQIGHAYFFDCRTVAAVDSVMRHKVIPLLAEYFYEDWDKVAAVLGDAVDSEAEHSGGFLVRRRLVPPSGTEDGGEEATRWRWRVRTRAEGFDYTRLQ